MYPNVPFVIEESKEEELLGIGIDQKLNRTKRTFIMSNFSYCPSIWMFRDRCVTQKLTQINERALQIAYQDRTSSFEELLITDNSVSIHQRNLQLLVTEIYLTRMNLNPPL